MSDKIKIAKLNFRLQKKTIAEIFEDDEITTKQEGVFWESINARYYV